MKLHFANFINYFIFHPKSEHLNARDQTIALVSSVALGVFTLGLVHIISAIITRCYTHLPADLRVHFLFQRALLDRNIFSQVASDLAPYDGPIKLRGFSFLLPVFICSRPVREHMNAA